MELTARQKVGQRLVVGFSGTVINNDIEELISTYKISNIILFKHNIENQNQLKKLCGDLQSLVKSHTGTGAFITIDQEGGMVTRLSDDCVNIPGAMGIAATGKVENAYQAGKITGEQLKALGINFNLAPVVDINNNIDNPVIGVRSYGDCPEKVAEYAGAVINGLLDGGVMAAAKHFPGHGDTNVDSHLGLPQINKTLEELERFELIPFQKAIEAGVPAIMTSHILFPKIERERVPATMSRTMISDLLKGKMGFEGLVISDCTEMQAIQRYYGTVEGVKRAVLAGVDLIFISHTAKLAREASDALTNALERGKISLEEMDASVEKIIFWKKKFTDYIEKNISFNVEEGKKYAYRLLKDSITAVQMPNKMLPELGFNPLFLGSKPFRATNVSNDIDTVCFAESMVEHFGGRGIIVSPDPTKEEIEQVLREAEDHSSIIIGTYNGNIYKGQIELVKRAAERNEKIIVVALRNPYDLRNLPKHVYGIAIYEYTISSIQALIELFENPFKLGGKLPVHM